ncbi:MAG: hypothetical protein ACI4CT_00305 [Lachnospiraceae bacterium]
MLQRTWKRLLSLLLCITMVLPSLSVAAVEDNTADIVNELENIETSWDRYNNGLNIKEKNEEIRAERIAEVFGTEEPVEYEGPLGNDGEREPVLTETELKAELQTAEAQVSLASTTGNTDDEYDLVVSPAFFNNTKRPDLDGRDMSCYVSPYNGDLQLNFDDLSLPGKNGLDLNLTRFYSGEQSAVQYSHTRSGNEKAIPNTYYMERYGLGLGWSFGFPSVEVKKSAVNKELYYHTGDGNVYHYIKPTTSSTETYYQTNLENYYTDNVVFTDGDTDYIRGDYQSEYSFKAADNTMQYFGSHGELLAIEDRYGNEIQFDYEDVPAENLLTSEIIRTGLSTGSGGWSSVLVDSEDTGGERYLNFDRTLLNNTVATITLRQIVLPKDVDNYHVSFSYDAKSDDMHTFEGSFSYKVSVLDYNYDVIHQTESIEYTPDTYNESIKIEQDIDLSILEDGDEPAFMAFSINIMNGKNNIVFDNLRISPYRPRLSEIRDTVNRKLTFSYVGDMYTRYENWENAEFPISVNVYAPNETTPYRTLTYGRRMAQCNVEYSNGFTITTRYFKLTGCDNGDYISGVQYTYDNGKGSATYRTVSNSNRYYNYYNRPMVSAVTHRNSTTYFEYEQIRKAVGSGFLDSYRVIKSYEKYLYNDNDEDGQQFGTTTYQYNLGIYADETGYELGTGSINTEIATRITHANGQQTTNYYSIHTFSGNKLKEEISLPLPDKEVTVESVGYNKEKITNVYEYNSPYAITSPSSVATTTSIGTDSLTTTVKYEYDATTSLLTKESIPLTAEELSADTIPDEKWMVTTYIPLTQTIHGSDKKMYVISQQSSYQNPGVQVVEQWEYDSMGNVISEINAEGDKVTYEYTDTTYPWLPTKSSISDPERTGDAERTSETQYAYTGNFCYGFGPTVTTTIDEDGNSSSTQATYNIKIGQIHSETDENDNTTIYTYDNNTGLCIKIRYPGYRATRYTNERLETHIYYGYYAEHNGIRYRFVDTGVWKYSTESDEGTLVSWQYDYYDDYGNLVYTYSSLTGSQEYDYDEALRITRYRNYRDFQQDNDTAVYQYDGFDRVTRVTDRENNQYKVTYGIQRTDYALVPAGTTQETNQYTELYDAWGRTITEKIYPDLTNLDTTIDTGYTYDQYGNVLSVTDGNGKMTSYQYDKLNKAVKMTRADGSVIKTRYSVFGSPTDIILTNNGEDHVISSHYDNKGNLIGFGQKGEDITVPDWRYEYYPNGNLKESVNPNGDIRRYGYDDSNNLTSYQYGNKTRKYYYNEYGKVSEIFQYGNDSSSEDYLGYTYNSHGLLISKQSDRGLTEYGYDEYHVLKQIKVPHDDITKHIRNYTVDSMERISTIESDTKEFVYTYTPDGKIASLTYPNTNIKTTYTYDNASRLTQLKTTKGSITLQNYEYTYDNAGNILTVSGTENAIYTYDDLYRLKSYNGIE